MMIDLIPEVLQATEPSRELDCLIFEAQHRLLRPCNRGTIDGEPTGEYYSANGDQLPERAPLYTSSIDAALTLMRKHYLWQLKQGIGCTAIVWWIEHDWDETGAPTAHSTTYPALALTTATLIARAVEDLRTTPAVAPAER